MMEKKDMLEIALSCAFLVIAALISWKLVTVMLPLINVVLAVLATFVVAKAFGFVDLVKGKNLSGLLVVALFGEYAVIAGIAVLVATFVITLLVSFWLADVVKLVAWMILTWYLFKLILYFLIPEAYKDLEKLVGGGE